MKQIFDIATLKLTAWYLLILMAISIIFSGIIYNIAATEIATRLDAFESRLERSALPPRADLRELREAQAREAKLNLFFGLFYINLAVLGLGGVGSYLLARQTLQPIKDLHEAESRFTSDASHELRTPLAIMKSELEVALRSKALTKPEMREVLESNLEEVDRLSTLANTLLQMSRQNYSDLEFNTISLQSELKAVVGQLNKQHDRITLSSPKKVLRIHGNQPSIRELLLILLDNAVRYSPPDSTVAVELSHNKTNAMVTITNGGEGILPQDLPHVFNRFYRGDKSRSSEDGGFGLGLSLAKKIVDMHDATISLQSQSSTTVATVSFALKK